MAEKCERRFIVAEANVAKAMGWALMLLGTFNARAVGKNRRGELKCVDCLGQRTWSGDFEIVLLFMRGLSHYKIFNGRRVAVYSHLDWSKFLRKLTMVEVEVE